MTLIEQLRATMRAIGDEMAGQIDVSEDSEGRWKDGLPERHRAYYDALRDTADQLERLATLMEVEGRCQPEDPADLLLDDVRWNVSPDGCIGPEGAGRVDEPTEEYPW